MIQGALTELSKGKTVIIIAHRLATIEAADQIIVVDDGHIIERGKFEKNEKWVAKNQESLQISHLSVAQKIEN